MFDVKLIRWHVVWLAAQCLFPIGLYGWFVAWLVGQLIWSHVTFQFSFYSTITTYHFDWHISAFKPRFHIRTLVDRLHANIMALVRQDLQTKVTDAFVHLNTRAPIARKETVGKKTFFIWWNTFMKNSTSSFKLSFDESNCQSYSANHSSVCSSRCLNPLLSILLKLSYPSVWLSGWLSSRVFFLPNSYSFVQNQFITYVLVLFPTVRWIQMTPSTVCFGARDDSYGFFRTSKAGNIITFKLTYKSGYVTCDARKSSFHSKWGCLWNRLIPNQMATLITDKNRNLLLPKSDGGDEPRISNLV